MTLVAVAHVAAVWIIMHVEPHAPEEPRPWRLVDEPCLHVGIRPATDGEGVALTLQVSICGP